MILSGQLTQIGPYGVGRRRRDGERVREGGAEGWREKEKEQRVGGREEKRDGEGEHKVQ